MRTISTIINSRPSSFKLSALALATAISSQASAANLIEEVVVTAQKRAENVQDIPIAISAYSGNKLEQAGVENTLDLQVIDPSLVFTTNSVVGQPYLRGVGTDIFSPGAESSIATFIDDVYQSRSYSSLQDFFDVQRVDVVKGPQGVLFGRNAAGGAISFYSNKPSDELEGKLSVGLGNYSKQRIEGMLNVPLIEDKLNWRIAGMTSRRDGYVENLHSGTTLDDEDYIGLRSHLQFYPSDDLSLLLSVNYSREDSTRNLGIYVDTSSGSSIADGFGAIRYDDPYKVAINENSRNFSESLGVNLSAELQLDGSIIKSITSYRDAEAEVHLDLDGSQLDYASNSPNFGSETITQEVQWISDNDSNLEWVTGIFLLKEQADQQLNVALTFPVPGLSDLLDQPDGNVVTKSFGLFGNAKYTFTDEWALSAGLRYSKDERELDFLQTIMTASTRQVLATNELKQDADYEALTPRMVLEYTPDEDTLAYASISRGYKAGGFSTNTFQSNAFDSEYVWAYELGLKSTLWEGRAQFNSAVFYYDYDDLQLNTIPPGSAVGTFQIVINAAAAKVQGFEFSSTVFPVDDLELNFSAQILDATFEDFSALNPNELDKGEVDRSGARMPRAPELSLSFSAEYEWQVADRPLTARVDVRHESEQFLDPFQDNAVERDQNTIINARVGYDLSDDMRISFWGRNLADKEVVQSSIRVDGLIGTVQFFAPPRTYGLTFEMNF